MVFSQAKTESGKRLLRAEWLTRVAFLAVFVINMQCAIAFIAWPEFYVDAYELGGVAGAAAVRGMGITFAMWNTTYPAFIALPRRFPVLGWVILAQQLVGLVGESFIYLTLPAGHAVLAAGIMRFVVFDGAGLVVMLAAFLWLTYVSRQGAKEC